MEVDPFAPALVAIEDAKNVPNLHDDQESFNSLLLLLYFFCLFTVFNFAFKPRAKNGQSGDVAYFFFTALFCR